MPPALRDDFRFQAGQHVAIRREVNGQEERRTSTIVNPEGAGSLTIGVRVQKDGACPKTSARREAGKRRRRHDAERELSRQQVRGRSRSYAAFAAGSGITPVLSIASTALARDPGSRFQLWYGNTGAARTMFLDEVLALKDSYLTRFSVAFVMSREPQDVEWFNGRIDAAKSASSRVTGEADVPAVDEFFVCGPGSMGEDIPRVLGELGAKGRVRVEHFAPVASGPAAMPAPPKGAAAYKAGTAAADADVTVVMDGRRRRFSMPRAGEVILDAAERAGLDLPFSCRAGVCSTCRARGS